MNADQAAYKKSSFGPAFLFLDKKRRQALATYYSFCRLMDDIADEPGVPDRAKELAFWRKEIDRAFKEEAETKLGQDIGRLARHFSMPQDRFLLLIEGMEADVHAEPYENLGALRWYLWRVAGIVGLATLDILGIKGPKAEELAYALGSAVQLTNIVRDVHEDAQLGRVYLPQDLLAKYGLTREDVLQNTRPQQLAQALQELAQVSKNYYKQAAQIMRALPQRKTMPCRVMGLVYRANLAKIERTGFVFSHTIKLSRAEKITQGIYALFQKDFAY